jgi:hypothetical protein
VKLKKYRVWLSRQVTESVAIEVVATSETEADQLAWEKFNDPDLQWTLDEGNIVDSNDVSVTDIQELEDK